MKTSHIVLAALSAIAVVGAIAPQAFLQPAPPPNPSTAPEPQAPAPAAQPSQPELPTGQSPALQSPELQTPSPPNPGVAPESTAPSAPSPPSTPELPSGQPPSLPNPGAAPEVPALPNLGNGQPPELPIDPSQLPEQEQIVGAIAGIVTAKFQNASCEELAQMQPTGATSETSEPQAAIQDKAIALLKANPAIREQFLNQVAPVIANKMFDCNFIP